MQNSAMRNAASIPHVTDTHEITIKSTRTIQWLRVYLRIVKATLSKTLTSSVLLCSLAQQRRTLNITFPHKMTNISNNYLKQKQSINKPTVNKAKTGSNWYDIILDKNELWIGFKSAIKDVDADVVTVSSKMPL